MHMKNVVTDIPNLIVVGAHMGGHRMYDEVAELLPPMNIYIDTSFAHYILGDKKFAWLIKKHGAHKVLFGSDSPWDNAGEQADIIERLDLSSEEKELIFYKNAQRLLKL
jgi:predicted TIM-barrel fold metal-dependent hydrolase